MSMIFATPLPPPMPGTGDVANPASLLTFISTAFSVDVTMTTANTFYDGPSISITVSGTYQFSGSILIQHDAAGSQIVVKLWDGTTTIAAAAGQNGSFTQYTLTPPSLAVGGTLPRTFKLSATSNGNGAVIKAASTSNSPGNYFCYLRAVRIGP